MPRTNKPYVPQTIGEIWDFLATFMLKSPTFKDDFFLERSIDTEFARLNESFQVVRRKLGEERYAALMDLSNRMRAFFEADPDDVTGEATAGRRLVYEMEDLLRPGRSKD